MDTLAADAQVSTEVTPEIVKAPETVQAIEWSGLLAQQGYVFGVDISGDGERVVLADLEGRVLGRSAQTRQPGEERGPDVVLARVIGLMNGLLDERKAKPREVLRTGVGFGGPVDSRHGRVRIAHDWAGWDNYPIAEMLEERFDVATLLDNDARLAALGEVWFGAGEGNLECDLVYLHWSTGVGGGIVSGGNLVRGTGTLAGEFGHTTVRTRPDALPCRCGGRGHLEAYVRASALTQRARDLLPADAAERAALVDVSAVFAAAKTNQEIAGLVEEASDLVAVTLANMITCLNPSLAVIGGRVARASAHLIPAIGERARSYAMPVTAGEVEFKQAGLGENSAVMGAVALALGSLR